MSLELEGSVERIPECEKRFSDVKRVYASNDDSYINLLVVDVEKFAADLAIKIALYLRIQKENGGLGSRAC